MLHDYAPDIVESMMLKPEWIQHYTWYGEFAWATNKKQQGIDVVMEGCLQNVSISLLDPTISANVDGTNWDAQRLR